ncbi:MAG TPA: hypothetical protein VGL86_29985 [Polyangia bacterium]
MRTAGGSTNPWGTSIDDGWKDLVVSSSPPPPPPREDAVVKNRPLPSNFNTWQEHGAAHAPVAANEEPSFSKSDRRLWVVAGSLMGAAVLVLGLLGALTFGAPAASVAAAAVEPPASVAPPAHVAAPAHPATSRTQFAALAKSSNPRLLKPASHPSRGRHHKRIASR